jgi:hypothetical protein
MEKQFKTFCWTQYIGATRPMLRHRDRARPAAQTAAEPDVQVRTIVGIAF